MSGFDGENLDGVFSPQDLIPGNPDALDNTIAGLMVGVSAQSAGNGMTRLCTGEGWTGRAAEAFRLAWHVEPRRWSQLGDALVNAAEALKPYRDAVRAGQAEAAVVLREWSQAQQASAAAAAEYARAWNAHEAAASAGQPVGALAPFTDPGAAGRAAALARLAAARTRVAEAGLDAARVLADSRDALPAEPGMWSRFGDGFVDTFSTIGTQASDFVGGAVDATIGMLGSVERLNPASAYNATHPQEYQQRLDAAAHAVTTAAGQLVLSQTEPPGTVLRSAADGAAQALSHDPGRVLGSLVPGVLLGTVTAGAGDVAAVAAEVVDGTAGELTTAADIAGQQATAGAGSTTGAGGIGADGSVIGATGWGEFGPGAAEVDAAVAASVQDSGAGLAKVEQDLSGIHVHPDAPLSGQEPAAAGMPGGSGLQPAHSVSRTTQWGSFGGWDQPVTDFAADAAAAAHLDAAGAGLGQVERDLAGIHINPAAGVDPSFAGRLVPGYLDPEYKAGDLARQAYRDKWPITAQDHAWLENIRKVWAPTGRMSDQELLALERFASPDGALFNTALRTDDKALLAELEPELRNLASALNKLPNYRGPAVRAVHVSGEQLTKLLEEYTPGTTVHEPGFTMASTDGPYRGNVRIIVDSVQGKDISAVVPGRNRVAFSAGEEFKTIWRGFDPVAKVWNIHVVDLGR